MALNNFTQAKQTCIRLLMKFELIINNMKLQYIDFKLDNTFKFKISIT